MTNYIENIDKIIEDGEEVLWKDRLAHIKDEGIYGEWRKNEQ
jgi:hypothetical protein